MTKRTTSPSLSSQGPSAAVNEAASSGESGEATKVVPKSEGPDQAQRSRIAKEMHSRVLSIIGGFTPRAFESGQLLNAIKSNGYYVELGFGTFKEYLRSESLAKSSAYSNAKIAEKFNEQEHGKLGIGKLRLLVSLKDAMQLIKEGIPFNDGKIDGPRRPVKDLKCDELRKYLAARKKLDQGVESD